MFESEVLRNFASDYSGKDIGMPLWPYEIAPLGNLEASVMTQYKRLEIMKFDKIMINLMPALFSFF